MTPRHSRRRRRASERGISLVFVTFAMAALLVSITGALVTGSANSQAASNYKGTGQVHFAAESGLSEAVQRINQTGIVHFQNDVITGWSTRWGTTWHAAPLSGFSYSVTPVVNATNAKERGRLVASATGPKNLQNVVVAEVQRTNNISTAPGAVYLATDLVVDPNFIGNAFTLNGNDTNFNNTPGPGTPVPGLSTRMQPNTQAVVGALNNVQLDNILGLGFQNSSPAVPSVMTSSWAPSLSQIDQFITDILALGYTSANGPNIVGNMSLGTISPPVPQITYSSGSITVKGAGNVVGSGIWVVEGDLKIQGTLDYAGLIIVRGKTLVEQDDDVVISGNAVVYGSLWSEDVDFQAGGNSVVNFSTQGLTLANQVAGGAAFPTTIRVASIADCAVVPAGANGCPN